MRIKLFEEREKRIQPQLDDKVLTDWNGLMISAFARCARSLNDKAYLQIAQKASDFVFLNSGRRMVDWLNAGVEEKLAYPRISRIMLF